jgi:uncharacterized protein (UPF0332 family)
LARHRLEQAHERLTAAKTLLKTKSYADAISRSYYAMFSAARALLATRRLDSKKHSGVISLFNQHFVKEGIVGSQWGRVLAQAKGFREESDYGDYVQFSQEEAKEQIVLAGQLLEEVESVLP